MADEMDFKDVGRWYYQDGIKTDWDISEDKRPVYEKHIGEVMTNYYEERVKAESDISEVTQAHYENLAGIVIKNLQRRNMNGRYASNRQEACSIIMEMIPEGATVSRGDSMTMDAVEVVPALIKRNKNKIVDPFVRKSDGSPLVQVFTEPWYDMHRQAFSADVFLTGTNAVTINGILVNTDGLGNRVAPMLFGPKNVIIAVGANKIVKDLNDALERIHQFAAPVNARRHAMMHGHTEYIDIPCVVSGKCADCNHEWRICRETTIIEGCFKPVKGRINVVIIGEELGI